MTNPALDRTFALLSVIIMEPPDDNFDETERILVCLGLFDVYQKTSIGVLIQSFLNAPSGKKAGARDTLVTMMLACDQQQRKRRAVSSDEDSHKKPRLDIPRDLAAIRASLKSLFFKEAMESHADWHTIIDGFFGHPTVQSIGPTTEIIGLLFDFLLSKTPAPYKDVIMKAQPVAIKKHFDNLEQFKQHVAPKCPSALSHRRHQDILYRARFDPNYETFASHLLNVSAKCIDPDWMLKFSEQYENFVKRNIPITMGPPDTYSSSAIYEYNMRVITAMIPTPVLEWMRTRLQSDIITFAQYKTLMEDFERDPPFRLDTLKDTLGYPSSDEYSLHGLRPVSVHPKTKVDRGADPFVSNPLLLQFPRMHIPEEIPSAYVCRPRHTTESVCNNLFKHYRGKSNATALPSQGSFPGSSPGKNKDSNSGSNKFNGYVLTAQKFSSLPDES
jgi:hypothetical protein